jgi:uncharacterized protein
MMLDRKIIDSVMKALSRQAAVALIGPRQVGKTTLAQEIAKTTPAIYLDLESSKDRAKLTDIEIFLSDKEGVLVIFDEIHRMPEIFQPLRGIIDAGRRNGKGEGRFLVLGSAAIELLQQSGETLAGRIEYIDINPFNILEVEDANDLWLRGGFPKSFLAKNQGDSFAMRSNFIRTYLERDVAQFGPRIASNILENLWTMLAHSQGSLLNASNFAKSLGVSSTSVKNYIDLLVDLLLVRYLYPYHNNAKKRLVKSPKTYIRDSGLLHSLLGIEDKDTLLGHPIAGFSWEGFVIENLLNIAPSRTKASFYRTTAGAEIDLLLEFGGNIGVWAIEIKKGLSPKLEKGFYQALDDIQPSKAFVVYSGDESYKISQDIEVIGLKEMAERIVALKTSPHSLK